MSDSDKRKIPVILLRDEVAIKSYGFSNYEYVGDPIQIAHIFSEKEVDELIIVDPFVSNGSHEINRKLLLSIANNFHGPLTYSGGVSSACIASEIIQLGYEKIAVNAATTGSRVNITDVASAIGKQALVLVFDLVVRNGELFLYNHVAQMDERIELSWIVEFINTCDVGEVLLQFVDRDGSRVGLESEITEHIAKEINKQLIVGCGAISHNEIKIYLEKSNTSAVVVSAVYTFYPDSNSVLINYE